MESCATLPDSRRSVQTIDAHVNFVIQQAVAMPRVLPTTLSLTCKFVAVAAGVVTIPLMVGVYTPHTLAHVRVTGVTYAQDIAPILQKKCLGCHATGGSAPIWLDTYARARNWSQTIRQQVLLRKMPPWPAEVGYAEFANDATLSSAEMDVLAAWADGGMPLGMPTSATPPMKAEASNADLTFEVPATPGDRAPPRFQFSTRLQQDRLIVAWTYRPTGGARVQEAILWIDGTKVGSWTPVETVVRYPPGVAQRLPGGAMVGLEVRAREGAGAPAPQGGTLELYLGADTAVAMSHRNLSCGATSIDRHIAAVSLTPRSAAGQPIELVVRHPNGSVDPLLVISHYDPRYPITYRFAAPVQIPRGAVVQVRSSDPQCSAALDFIPAPRSSR